MGGGGLGVTTACELINLIQVIKKTHNYRPQRSCGQGYVFTHVCDSVHRGGLRAGRTPPGRENPLARRPPWQEDPPARRTPPSRENPPPGRRHHPPWGSRYQHTVNERPVRILLECILVFTIFSID